ncbi:MAG: nuclear transport factor 2 family protein [Halobacteriota archaeon]
MIGVFLAKKAIADTYEAVNQRNLSKFMSTFSDDMTFIYPKEAPQSGTFKGKGAFEGFMRSFLDQFPRFRFDIQNICFQNIFDFTGTNVAVVHWNIQMTNRDGVEGTNSGVSVFEFKRGKVFFYKEFIFDQGENYKLMWGLV